MVDTARNGYPAALFIAPIMPSDSGNGLSMRTGFLLDTYAKRFTIDLVVIPVAGGTTKLTPFVASRVRRATILQTPGPDTHYALIDRIADREARLAAFRLYARPSIAARLRPELKSALLAFAGDASYMLVHVSRLYLADLAGAWMRAGDTRPYLVLDCDEDDVSAYRRFAGIHRKWGHSRLADWALAEADAFKTMAAQLLPRFDLLLAASTGEARLLSTHAQGIAATVVPNVAPGRAVRAAPAQARGRRRDILFLGNMSYLPNIDAALWFAARIWPMLVSAVPFSIRLVVAGSGAPPEIKRLAKRTGIAVVGRFEDVAPLYRHAALAIVPIRAGGGTRIKLLESANYGVPIVATRLGAAGTGFRSGYELLLADSEREFAASCARLLTDGNLAARLAAQAMRKVRRDYDAGRSATRLLCTIGARG